MFIFDATHLRLIADMDKPSFDPIPLIDHIFSPDPPQIFIPHVTRSVLSGNAEPVYESLLGGLHAIAGDTNLSVKDKEDLTKNLDSLQDEVCKRTDGKKWVLIPESIATKTLCMHPQFGLELTISHKAKQTLITQDTDLISFSSPLIEANKKAFREAFIDDPTSWNVLIKPYLEKLRDYVQKNAPRPSYMDSTSKPEFARAVSLYAASMQTLLQKPSLQLDASERNLFLS